MHIIGNDIKFIQSLIFPLNLNQSETFSFLEPRNVSKIDHKLTPHLKSGEYLSFQLGKIIIFCHAPGFIESRFFIKRQIPYYITLKSFTISSQNYIDIRSDLKLIKAKIG